MRFICASAALLLTLTLNCLAQDVIYPVKNYTTRNYGTDYHPSNYSVAQDSRGIIYAANGFKLLEFDGVNWNSYPINKAAWILSVAVNKSGFICTGSQKEFGYFAPDQQGTLKYVSQTGLAKNDSSYTNIWKVSLLEDRTIYQAQEKLFISREGKLKTISPATSFHTSFVVNDRFFVRDREKGLFELKNDSLVFVEGSHIFDTTGIFMMVPAGRGSKNILIGTLEKGFWLFDDSTDSFRPFTVIDNGLFGRAGISDGVLADNGMIAIGTRTEGLVLMDSTGKICTVINKGNGLSDNGVNQVISDQSGNLWLALNNGISHVEISSPLAFYQQETGLQGGVNCLLRHKSILYAGTNAGLFRWVPGARFVREPGINGSVRCLSGSGEFLIAGTDEGLYQSSGGSFSRLDVTESFTLCNIPSMKLLLSGGSKGLTIFRTGVTFQKTSFAGISNDIIGILPGEESADASVIWLGTRYEGAIKLTIRKDLTYITEAFGTADGLPEGPVNPFTLEKAIVFATGRGLHSFTPESVVRDALPDSLKINPGFPVKGFFSPLEFPGDPGGNEISWLDDHGNKIWSCSANRINYLDKNNNMKPVSRPFAGIDAGKVNCMMPEDNICWIGTSEGLIRYDGEQSKDYDRRFLCLIRRVKDIFSDTVFFNGTSMDAGSKFIVDQPSGIKPVIPYRNNSIIISYSSPFFEYPSKTEYSYRMNGEKGWSSWKSESSYEDDNLREGHYTFSVKARNVYGVESLPAKYSFVVLPPWYRSPWAYTIYIIAGILLVWLIAWFYSYRLKLENIRLEGIVAERTSEIAGKNTVLEHQKKEIEDSIRYARRIQSAVIPSEKECTDLLPESFVFFRPLNIVSGDFYWISHVAGKIVFAAADCTGHGVPGAFMSMLGVAFLNEIVNRDMITEPDLILGNLRKKVIEALQHKGITETRDGMDIAIVCVDPVNNILHFSGAFNPLVLIRNNEVSEIQGDKMPIGIYEKMDPFTRHKFTIERGDCWYMYSDGYEDQFGGPSGKKFKARKLRQLLLDIHQQPMAVQKEMIEKQFIEWKGVLDQIDDVVVTGFSFR